MLSDIKRPLVEFYFTGDSPAFVCGVFGNITINVLEEIEKTALETDDLFDKGTGTYLFLGRYYQAQVGDEGRTEIPQTWEFEFLDFKQT